MQSDYLRRAGRSLITLDAEVDSREHVLVCDVGEVNSPDLATIEALCRLRLAVADRGYAVHLREASPGLMELLGLCGLEQVLPLVDEGQPEQGEQPGGVEEVVEPGDTPF
jgi:anti-anti-sigma regulatory factor